MSGAILMITKIVLSHKTQVLKIVPMLRGGYTNANYPHK